MSAATFWLLERTFHGWVERMRPWGAVGREGNRKAFGVGGNRGTRAEYLSVCLSLGVLVSYSQTLWVKAHCFLSHSAAKWMEKVSSQILARSFDLCSELMPFLSCNLTGKSSWTGGCSRYPLSSSFAQALSSENVSGRGTLWGGKCHRDSKKRQMWLGESIG